MTNGRTCPECERPLPADAREEVCPACALESLLKFVTADASAQSSGSGIAQPSTLNAQLSTRFGDYELLELLARGGMGVVYKARQLGLNRTVALKTIQAGVLATPAEVKRFNTEAEAIAQLHHPNIVAVYEIGEHEGQHYFSMEYVAGRTLAEIVRDGPLLAKRAASYVKTVAAAVHHAHQQGILHRDLKPANIIVDEQDQPRITDFGLAKRLDQSAITLSGQVLGSPNYLPPEQAEPKRGILGPPSDVYALGAILYHLVTGRPPFQAESLTTLLRQVIETDPVAPRSLNPGIARDLETICLKCLEKEPQRRYDSAQALAEDLDRFLNNKPVRARPIGAAGRTWRWCRRYPVRAGLGASLVLVLVLGIVGISWQWRRAERERDMALRLAYAGDMNLAQRSLEEGDLGRARALLDRYRPKGKSEGDLRGWEWRYLWGLSRSDAHDSLALDAAGYLDLAMAPDGHVLATRKWSGDIDLWDVATRQRTATLTNQSWGLTMCFAPDGHFLISGNQQPDGSPVISFWDLGTRKIVRDLPLPSPVDSLALSPDGKRLATCHTTKEPGLRVWAIPSGELLLEVPTTESLVGTLPVPVFSPDGTKLALGGNSGEIRVFDLATVVPQVLPAPVPGQGVCALAFSSDGRLLASGYAWSHTAIHLWDAATGQPLGRLEGHRNFVERLVFARDGQTLYSAGHDQSIRVWDVLHRKQIGRLQGHTSHVSGLALCPDARRLISCGQDGSIRCWDLEAGSRPPAEVVLPVRVGLYASAFTEDSRTLITASPSAPVTLWEVATTNEIGRITALGSNNQSLALCPGGRLLAVGGSDGTLKVWDIKSHCLVKQWRPHDRIPVLGLQFLDGGKSLLSAGMAPGLVADIKRWEVGSWTNVSFGAIDLEYCFGLTQSPDQRLFAVSYCAAPVKIWSSTSSSLKATLGSEGGFTPTFSPDGHLVAAAVRSCARIWEVGSWRPVAVLQQLSGGTQCVAFSPDGARVAAGSIGRSQSDPVVHIWDHSVGRELLSLHSQDLWTGYVEFSPDGNTLLAVSWHGLAKLWHAPSWAEVEAEEKAEGKEDRETVRP